MRYELFYLIGASREADSEKIRSEIKKMVEEAGGKFEEKETVEKRRLAYQIKHETHGIYVAQRFELEQEKVPDLNIKLNLYPGKLRFIVSRADELPELKSKEERITEANSKAVSAKEEARKKEERVMEEKAKEEKKTDAVQEKPKESAPKDDDIDKKLEEILNI